VNVTAADFERDYEAIRFVRFTVFVDEQRVPPDIEMDDRDPHCEHLLARDGRGEPVGTGRLDVAAGGKIGRVAVLASARGSGVGTALMRALHALASERGLSAVWCNAQLTAVPFYSGLGYRTVGTTFEEAGIDHVRMEREL
jgi:predicted GNAT family N-acyltransferase